ncbi:MAG: flagellin [bacterium]|nr:flagellin [bacterium]
MSLSIYTASQGMLRAFHQTGNRLERTFSHLATGKRVATAQDDAAALAIGERLTAKERSLHQGGRNLQDGYGLAATAEGALGSSHDTLHRMRELSVQAQNGTLSSQDRATIQQEFDALAATLDQTAPSPGTTTITDGNGGEIAIDVADASSTALGVNGLDASDPATLGTIDQALGDVSRARSSLGSAMNSSTYRSEAVSAVAATQAAARERLVDADYAQEIANLTRDRILGNMQLAGLAVAGRSTSATFDLIG